MTGDYGRAAAERFDREPSTLQPRQRCGGRGGATAAHDRHYSEWRQRQIDEIDRDYDDYRREHQSKFESDFSNWRSTRQSKRQLLGSIKEHMQVFGGDEQPVGTVDKVRGDRVILTKNDSPDAQHHSINCAMIDRVEGDRVILDKNAEEAKAAFGSEERDRALVRTRRQSRTRPAHPQPQFLGHLLSPSCRALEARQSRARPCSLHGRAFCMPRETPYSKARDPRRSEMARAWHLMRRPTECR